MYHLIYKYLILNRQVVIPGIGLFSLHQESAKYDAEQKLMHAPLTVVKFQAKDGPPGNEFYTFLSSEMNIGEVNATEEFQEFAFQLKQGMISKKWVVLPGMGILTNGLKNEIEFKPAAVLKKYFPAIPVGPFHIDESERVEERQETTENVYAEDDQIAVRKDYWWVYAIVLALISILAIVYYYSTL